MATWRSGASMSSLSEHVHVLQCQPKPPKVTKLAVPEQIAASAIASASKASISVSAPKASISATIVTRRRDLERHHSIDSHASIGFRSDEGTLDETFDGSDIANVSILSVASSIASSISFYIT